MPDIRLTILTQGGDQHEIEAPADILVADLVRDLGQALAFSLFDSEGRPISWRVDNMATGRTLDRNLSLEQQGVAYGSQLSLIRSVTAGCFGESSQILLPDGAKKAIGDLQSGDMILAYHAGDASYRPEKVKGVYRQTYSSLIRLNHVLETSIDQHFLLADGRWALASELKAGDLLVSFPFSSNPVTSISRQEELKSLISLTLAPFYCLVVEGFVARDLIGKQEHLPRAIDIFLSYSEPDKDQSRKLFDILEKGGKAVFLSERSLYPGEKWADAILESLRNCKEFWALVTPNSLRSEWVTTEWAAAWALGKKIVPVLFRCRPEDLPERLRAYQCVDFHEVRDRIAITLLKGL